MRERVVVRNEEHYYGSILVKDLCEAVSLGGIPFSAEVLNTRSNLWQPMGFHASVARAIAQEIKNPKMPWDVKSIYGNWFIKAQDQDYGPFSLLQMVEFSQQKRLRSDCLVRHPEIEEWKTLTDVYPFDDRSMKSLFLFDDLQKVFTRRKNPRVDYSNEVFINLEDRHFLGLSFSLSKQGIGIVLEQKAPMRLKDRLNIVINRNSEHGMIQSKCQVVSIGALNGQDRLGLVFDQEIDSITEYIDRRIPA